jgi:hypothetical protein
MFLSKSISLVLLAFNVFIAQVGASELLADATVQSPEMILTGSLSLRDNILSINSSCRELILFTAPNQFLEANEGIAKGSLITGTTSTAISLQNERLTLHEGLIIVDTGSSPLKVATKVLGLIVEPRSTVLVRYQPGKAIRVQSLAVPSKQAVKVRFAQCRENMNLACGEAVQLDLTDATAQPEMITAGIGEFVQSLPKAIKGPGERTFPRMRNRMTSAVESARCSQKSFNTNAPVRVIAKEGTRLITARNGAIEILDGQVLIATKSAQIIETRLGRVVLKPDAVASVGANPEELRVQCYTCPGSVEVFTDSFRIPLAWGKETVAVQRQVAWTDALPEDGVARRSFEAFRLPHSNCVVSEFAIESTISAQGHLSVLRKPASAETRHLRDRLLKTAAAVQMITRGKGTYRLRKHTINQAS